MTGKFQYDNDDALDYILNNSGSVKCIEFNYCCGASIIANFPEISKIEFSRKLRDTFASQWDDYVEDFYGLRKHRPNKPSYPNLNEIIEGYVLSSVEKSMKIRSGHLYFVILNETQSWIGQYLKKKDFRLVSDRTVNRNSGQRLFVYLRDPLDPKGKAVKKRTFR